MPGSGKTAVGGYLTEMTGRKLIDTDALVAEAAGMDIPRIFAEKGENYFRRLETEVLRKVSKESGCVISTGGGIVTVPENRALLGQNSVTILIDYDIGKLTTEGRPLSQSVGVEELYRVRKPLYEAWSSYRFLQRYARSYGEADKGETGVVKILVINGPNLNMLGVREPEIYDTQTLKDLEKLIQDYCEKLGIDAAFFQSNHEGAIVDVIQAAYKKYDGIIINPACVYPHQRSHPRRDKSGRDTGCGGAYFGYFKARIIQKCVVHHARLCRYSHGEAVQRLSESG